MTEDRLLHLIRKKKGFFEAILDLTETESSLSLPEWISVLEQKKILLSCIEEIDHQMTPYQSRLHILSQEMTEEIDSLKSIIEKILHLDKQSQEKRKQELKG